MNFQMVEQANGNLITMFGTFIEIGGLQYTPQKKAKAICKIRDDNGVEHNVHIYQGKGQLPSPEQYNEKCQFNLSTFQGNYQGKPYTGYSGFWNSQAQTQAGQPAPQRTPKTPQAAPQSPKPDWDAISRGKVRHGVVCAYIQSGNEPELTTVEFWTDYIMSGKVLDPTGGNSPDAESEDDIPF